MVVDLDEFGVLRNAGLEVRTLRADAVGGEDHVVGGEVVAVLELDALAQMKAPAGRLRGLPTFGEAGENREILAALRQAFIDVAEMGVGRRFVERVGVERLEVALIGVAQRLRRNRRGREGRRGAA